MTGQNKGEHMEKGKEYNWRYRLYRLTDAQDFSGDGRFDFDYYDMFMIVVILISLIPLAFKEETEWMIRIDQVTALIFTVDYILRWITADLKMKMPGKKAFLIYPFTFMAVVDLVSILPSVRMLPIFASMPVLRKILYSYRGARTLRVIRAIKGVRYSRSVDIILSVLKRSSEPLMAVAVLALTYILVSALIIFNVEPDSFGNYFDAVYWATISLTTVGYGDLYPVTVVGRMVAMVSSLFGVAIVALPSGIITAGYMQELNKRAAIPRSTEKNKEEKKPQDNIGKQIV